ncbi:hypothetical protein LUZ62_047385 [Rhynchospora pubera]|uniref:Uncharacterized protein n=1 Tax=Rhynchospora pubera TaxID=906938 RepID=A0AAV8FYY6_9POAL|nr:hypothetical protein LUZ62_047380 [Rhynchospora pubera]KAJ4796136.1 hypothetical protein LUZ62_047382 [Rhynchospora pubera]KAJ4796139.1 hypothetical protein LUZ62_047385 [Rhynchospora pubera]
MAAQAEEPLATAADPSPPTAPMLRRASPDDAEEEKQSRDTKRRRTCVEALESLETEKDCSLDSFSFEARSIAPIETTPKFGSFNPVLSLESPIVASEEAPPPEKVPDVSQAEAGTEVEAETVVEAEAVAEGEEREGDSEGKNGNSQCSEAE